MSAVAAAIIGGSIITGVVASKSASKAAKAQKEGIETAAATQLEAQKLAIASQEAALEKQIELNKPFHEAGVAAIEQLQLEVESGAPTFDEFVQSPEAAALREQELADITKATERSAAARGNLFAPRTQLELQERALQKTRASKFGQFDEATERRDKQLNRLTDLVNIGRGASTQSGQAIGQAGTNISNIITGTGENIASGQIAAGDATASGYINTSNAITSAVGDITSTVALNRMGSFN